MDLLCIIKVRINGKKNHYSVIRPTEPMYDADILSQEPKSYRTRIKTNQQTSLGLYFNSTVLPDMEKTAAIAPESKIRRVRLNNTTILYSRAVLTV
jgi:hypothetical protein